MLKQIQTFETLINLVESLGLRIEFDSGLKSFAKYSAVGKARLLILGAKQWKEMQANSNSIEKACYSISRELGRFIYEQTRKNIETETIDLVKEVWCELFASKLLRSFNLTNPERFEEYSKQLKPASRELNYR